MALSTVTDRDLEVAALISLGMNDGQIAATLALPRAEISRNVVVILEKLELGNRIAVGVLFESRLRTKIRRSPSEIR